jgi:hypothetical protein
MLAQYMQETKDKCEKKGQNPHLRVKVIFDADNWFKKGSLYYHEGQMRSNY